MFKLRLTAVAAALMLSFTAWAQQPLAGEFLDPESGVLFRFVENADGSLSGEMVGATGALPLNMESAGDVLQAWFEVEGEYAGLYGELADQDTLNLWLYFMDETGQPIPGTEEQAVVVRQDPEPEQPAAPSFTPPAMPGFAPPGARAEAAAETDVEFTGVWDAELEVAPGVNLQVELTMNGDGTYRHEISAATELVAWEAGSYSVSGEGTLQMSPNEGSEEMCFQGACEPLDLEASTFLVEFLADGELKLTEIDAGGTALAEVLYEQRSGGAGSPAGEMAPGVPPFPPATAPEAPAPGQTPPPAPPTF